MRALRQRAIRLGLLVAIAAVAGAGALAAQQPSAVDVKLSTEKATVGDPVEATLTLVWDGEAPAEMPRFPAWQESWGDAEVVTAGEVEAFPDQAGRRIYKQKVTLTAFTVGEVKLPPQKVAVPLAGETVEIPTADGIGFEVRSVLPEDAAEIAPQPPAPPVALPEDWRFLVTTAVLALACVAATVAFFRRLGQSRVALGPTGRPLLPPLEEFLAGLGRLDRARAEPAHTGLSLAFRAYLGRRLGIHARESSTSEIQRQLRGGEVPQPLAQRAVRLLRDCDQVKFARQEVDPATTEARLGAARELAGEVEEWLRPPPAAEEKVA